MPFQPSQLGQQSTTGWDQWESYDGQGPSQSRQRMEEPSTYAHCTGDEHNLDWVPSQTNEIEDVCLDESLARLSSDEEYVSDEEPEDNVDEAVTFRDQEIHVTSD